MWRRAYIASFYITLRCMILLSGALNYNATITLLEKWLFIFNQISKFVHVNRDMKCITTSWLTISSSQFPSSYPNTILHGAHVPRVRQHCARTRFHARLSRSLAALSVSPLQGIFAFLAIKVKTSSMSGILACCSWYVWWSNTFLTGYCLLDTGREYNWGPPGFPRYKFQKSVMMRLLRFALWSNRTAK